MGIGKMLFGEKFIDRTPEMERQQTVEFYERDVDMNNSVVEELEVLKQIEKKPSWHYRQLVDQYRDLQEDISITRENAAKQGIILPDMEILTYS